MRGYIDELVDNIKQNPVSSAIMFTAAAALIGLAVYMNYERDEPVPEMPDTSVPAEKGYDNSIDGRLDR